MNFIHLQRKNNTEQIVYEKNIDIQAFIDFNEKMAEIYGADTNAGVVMKNDSSLVFFDSSSGISAKNQIDFGSDDKQYSGVIVPREVVHEFSFMGEKMFLYIDAFNNLLINNDQESIQLQVNSEKEEYIEMMQILAKKEAPAPSKSL